MKSKYNIDTVSRAVAVLRQILEQGSVPLDAAAAHTAVSKSTAFRLLTTLQNEGLVERASGGGYQLGPELIRWGLLVLGKLDVPSAAAHELRELWLATKETVGLGLVSGASVVLAEILESPSPFRCIHRPWAMPSEPICRQRCWPTNWVRSLIAPSLRPRRSAFLRCSTPWLWPCETVTRWTMR
jgi:molybdenum-dependent DNA-binding transcriptional regulator ModE